MIDTKITGQLPDSGRIARTGKVAERLKQAAELDAAAQDFEAVFIAQMLQHMFEGVKADQAGDENFGGGAAENIYREMMVDEFGKIMAKAGGIGLADHVKREMLKLQEVK